MKKILKWILRIVLGIVIILVLFVGSIWAYFSISSNQRSKAAEAKMVAVADKIEVDGHTFRDLNRNGVLDPYEDFRVPLDERVEDVLSQMTVEEKAGMMIHPHLFEPTSMGGMPGIIRLVISAEDIIVNREIRHVTSALVTEDPTVHVRWHNRLQELAEGSRLGIPVTVSSDPRHSAHASIAASTMHAFSKWPEPLGFGAILVFTQRCIQWQTWLPSHAGEGYRGPLVRMLR